MSIVIPERLAENCSQTSGRTRWLERLPDTVREMGRRWSLTLGDPFEAEVSCAWVAPVVRADGSDAVLKIGMPHMESEHEIAGLRFWEGDPTVRLYDFDEASGAMLLERCLPGTPLRDLDEPEQDVVICGLLRRLWRTPAQPHPFRPLSALVDYWSAETRKQEDRWTEPALVREGLRVFAGLSRGSSPDVLLATDLHAGNVLRAAREPWLAIDPKPFIGDAAYDATQHLFNCQERVRDDPGGTIGRVAGLLGVDDGRVRLWTFARAAAEPRDDWTDDAWFAVARAIAP